MFGQMPDFSQSFEMLRKMWEQSAVPAGLMPGMSGFSSPPVNLDELEKRIQDLKAVESWLQLNTNLLRSTIQGLEVQRATLVALQTFGATLSPEAVQATMARRTATSSDAADTSATTSTMGEPSTPRTDSTSKKSTADDPAAASGGAPTPDNAALWWDVLQQQFNQIASAAAAATVQPFGSGVPAGAGSERAAEQTSKPARGTSRTTKPPTSAKKATNRRASGSTTRVKTTPSKRTQES